MKLVGIAGILCFVCLFFSISESNSQDMEYLIKMEHSQVSQPLNQNYILYVSDVEGKNRDKPPLKSEKVSGEIVAGVAGEICGAFLGMLSGQLACVLYGTLAGIKEPTDRQVSIGEDVELVFAIAFLQLGSAIGVYLVGRKGDETGSFKKTLASGVLGTLGLGVLGTTLKLAGLDISWGNLTTIALLAGPAIGSTAGFNMTRKYELSANSDNQINKSDRLISFDLVRMKF
jgi:hypothetical protein